MHFFIGFFVIVASYRWGDWRNWKKYHTTMTYFAMGNLLYHYLCANHLLWQLKPDVSGTYSITEMVYTFIIFPGTALLFLSNYPQGRAKVIRHYAYWVLIYGGMEYVLYLFGRIHYQYGWGFGWSVLFDCTMFPMLKLFSVKPLRAYLISAVLTVFWVILFKIPVNVPIEFRRP
ncbi:CBO0543 family protein [Paenibacillus sp. GCM10027628]|uniref:CBO0543 family protein n=1 Tax=Paenibacillus sp. GCM10027628 TaxID=3273413 RepID=UPI00362761C6